VTAALPAPERARLRTALLKAHPWLKSSEHGPASVDAGECDRCSEEARLVDTCGPIAWRRLGRRCAAEVGVEAWCDGHLDDADDALAWLASLPAEADDAARLWWVATGEVRLESLAALASRCLSAETMAELNLG
jgi:hypothetical protein